MPAPAPGASQSAGPTDAGGAVTLLPVQASRFRKASEGGFLEEAVAGPGFGDWSWVAARLGRSSAGSDPAQPYWPARGGTRPSAKGLGT